MLNSNTLEGRKTLTIMVLRLFDLWELSLKEQAQHLGYSPNSHNTIRRLIHLTAIIPSAVYVMVGFWCISRSCWCEPKR